MKKLMITALFISFTSLLSISATAEYYFLEICTVPLPEVLMNEFAKSQTHDFFHVYVRARIDERITNAYNFEPINKGVIPMAESSMIGTQTFEDLYRDRGIPPICEVFDYPVDRLDFDQKVLMIAESFEAGAQNVYKLLEYNCKTVSDLVVTSLCFELPESYLRRTAGQSSPEACVATWRKSTCCIQ